MAKYYCQLTGIEIKNRALMGSTMVHPELLCNSSNVAAACLKQVLDRPPSADGLFQLQALSRILIVRLGIEYGGVAPAEFYSQAPLRVPKGIGFSSLEYVKAQREAQAVADCYTIATKVSRYTKAFPTLREIRKDTGRALLRILIDSFEDADQVVGSDNAYTVSYSLMDRLYFNESVVAALRDVYEQKKIAYMLEHLYTLYEACHILRSSEGLFSMATGLPALETAINCLSKVDIEVDVLLNDLKVGARTNTDYRLLSIVSMVIKQVEIHTTGVVSADTPIVQTETGPVEQTQKPVLDFLDFKFGVK